MINGNICYTITDKLLGKGGFGFVYLCNDQNNKEYAIKCCNVSKEIGITHLLEPIIMSTILHPYLNHSEKIYVSENKLYMIQEVARTDLAQYTRRYKKNYRPSTSKLKFWCYCIIKGLSALHNNNIIHGDIKASNILLYYDDTIKLSDFNLSVLKINKDTRYTHKICTITHRPLEVLKKLPWNESVDIWSLGCTFYEIAYGLLLFPCQNEKNRTKCYINSILEWDKFNNKNLNVSIEPQEIDLSKFKSQKNFNNSSIIKILDEPDMYSVDYNSPSLCDESKDLSKLIFNDLLHKMLISDQYKRCTIKDLLNHPFITNLSSNKGDFPLPSVKYQLIKCVKNKILDYDKEILINYINNITNDKDVVDLTIKIYNGTYFITDYTQELKVLTCILIASKLLHKNIPIIQNDILPTIISIESSLCNNLKFHFNL